MSNNNRLDIVIFGATGFTGKCVVEELYRINKLFEKNIKWGIAGRSVSKLQALLDNLQKKNNFDDSILQNVEVIVADVNDEASLQSMCLRSKVIINCCGPYRFYGEPLVKACIECNTHHVDVSGEPAYMEKMQLKYNKAAKEANVYVISACGFDSIPTDLGVIYLQNNFEGDVNSVEAFLNFIVPDGKGKGRTIFNYATWESLIHSFGEVEDLKHVRKQLFPTRIPVGKPKLKERWTIHKNEIDKLWYLPLPGADRAVVNRTQRYLNSVNNQTPVQFNAYVAFPSLTNAVLAVFCGMILNFFTKYSAGRTLLLKHPKIFTFGLASKDGPSEETMEHLQFLVRLCGEGRSTNKEGTDQRVTVEVTGTNPMYGATSIASIFCALTILKEQDKMPEGGGVLTPAAAFRNTTLINKLTQHCMNFKIVNKEFIKSKL